jgi:hypothetical protein
MQIHKMQLVLEMQHQRMRIHKMQLALEILHQQMPIHRMHQVIIQVDPTLQVTTLQAILQVEMHQVEMQIQQTLETNQSF